MVPSAGSALEGPSGGNIADVVGLILDKGLVIDAYVRVSLIGIEILTIDARVVVGSIDTYLRFVEEAGRLNLEANSKPGLPELIQGVTGAVGSITGAASGTPASLGPAQDAAAFPTDGGAASATHDGADDDDPVALSSKRERGNQR